MAHLVLARKYRPHRFEDVIGQPHVVQALSNALNNNQLNQAYLLTGTRGVGKTTIARILAKCLNCEKGISATPCGQCDACTEIDTGRFIDLFEIDAASRTKVEDTRELLDNVQYAATKGRYKVYLIDEVHMLSGHSFNALLKTLEEPPPHVVFILATTDPEKMPATVLSRCLRFHLLALNPTLIASQCESLLKQEETPFESDALPLLAEAANGSVRDALSLLDQACAFSNNNITTEAMHSMLGTVSPTYLTDIFNALLAHDANALLAVTTALATLGASFLNVTRQLLSTLHTIAILQVAPDATVPTGQLSREALMQFATTLTPNQVQLYYQITLKNQDDLPLAPSPRMGFDMMLLRLMNFSLAPTTNNEPSQLIQPTTQAPTQPATSAPTSAAAPTSATPTSATRWPDYLPTLGLTGAAMSLAQNLSLKEKTDDSITFLIEEKHMALAQKKYIQRLSAALTQHFGKPVKAVVSTTSTPIQDTPMANNQLKKKKKKDSLTESLQQNTDVQRIMDTFDAALIPDSITTQGDKS